MTAYAIARLRNVNIGPDIADYLRGIDATLEPFGGKYVIHGGQPRVKEGAWEGDLVVISFPTVEDAEAWYGSPQYQAILPLRTENSASEAIIVEGASPSHKATDILPLLGLA